MENNSRAEALAWWRTLTTTEQQTLSAKSFPGKSFILIHSSSSKIQQIYENNQK